MGTDQGVLPTQTQVSGAFGILRNVIVQVKEKMLGHLLSQNQSSSPTSDSIVNTPYPDIAPPSCLDNTEIGQVKGMAQSSEAVRNSLSYVKNISKIATPHTMEEKSSDYTVMATSSEIIKIPDNQENTEYGDPGSLLNSQTIESSLGNDKNFLVAAAAFEIKKHPSKDMVSTAVSEVGECMTSETVAKVGKMYNNVDSREVDETAIMVQLPGILIDSKRNKKNVSTSVISQSEETHHTSKQVGPVTTHTQLIEVVADIATYMRGSITKSQKFSYIKPPFLNEGTSSSLPKDGVEELTGVGNGNCQHDEMITSSGQPSSAGTQDDKNLAPSGSAPKVTSLSSNFKRKTNTPALGEMTSEKGFALTLERTSEDSNKTSGENVAEGPDIRLLIDFIKDLPGEQIIRSQDDISNQVSNRGLPMKEKEVRSKDPVRRIQSCPDLRKSGNKAGPTQKKKSKNTNDTKQKCWTNTLFENNEENRKSDNEEEVQCPETPVKISQEYMSSDASRCLSEFEAIHHALEPDAIVPCPASKDPNKDLDTSSIGEGSEENKVLMRFLLKCTPKKEILSALKDCGPITKISELSDVKGSNFKDAYVYFKTSTALQKVLKKTDLVVEDVDVIMEGTSSLEIKSHRIPIPDLIGDPDVPSALIKNPIRTAKIKGLTLDMRWKDIEKALSSWKGIAGFIMGSSSSVAYVEFETEDDKEKAIAEHSFQVLGKSLQVFRIDAPRTTVARISNISTQKGIKKISSLCGEYGQVKKMVHREPDIMDVHFKLEEWPNMIHILNNLNGRIVDESQWIAVPATVYPPAILRTLWSQPDGREHVQSTIHNLLQKIGKSHTDVEVLTDVVANYYGKMVK